MRIKSPRRAFIWSVLITISSSIYTAALGRAALVQIEGFRYGLVEFDSSGRPRIYEEGNSFPYKINGTCVAAGKESPCQWRGFEFSFQSPDDITTFECMTTSDQPQTYTYPDAIVATNSQTARWVFSVQGRAGRYIRPQYTLGISDQALRMTTTCSSKGEEVLRWQVMLTPSSAK